MPATAAETLRFTPEEYFAWEEGQEVRHEYHYGEVFAMSGGTFAHVRLTARLVAALSAALRDRDCAVLSEAMRVEVLRDAQYVYPDVTVVCGPPSFRGRSQTTLRNPTVVCEVLSPATAAYDRGEKLALYRGVGSIQAVVYADPDRRTVELARRDGDTWVRDAPVDDGAVRIAALGVDIAWGDLFDGPT